MSAIQCCGAGAGAGAARSRNFRLEPVYEVSALAPGQNKVPVVH
jgi:hypothetical protein